MASGPHPLTGLGFSSVTLDPPLSSFSETGFHCDSLAVLELRTLPASASRVKVCTTTAQE